MIQHILAAIIFGVCVYLVIRRIVRYISQAKRGNAQCGTCSETSCPLHQANTSSKHAHTRESHKKNADISKNCKKTSR